MSDVGKRVHTLLTDGAVAGLSDAERAELEVLLGGEPIDPSYEHAAAAIELSLLGHTEELPIELEAAIVQQAGRYFGFTALRPREPTLGADADATPVRRIWERSPDNIDEFTVLESSLTNGRIDRVGSGEILISDDGETSGEHREAERAEQFDSEVDASLDALEQREREDDEDDEAEDELEDEDDDELEDEDDERPVAEPQRKSARPRKRSSSKARKQARAPEESQRPTPPDNRMLRWATYASAMAALALLVVALWLFATRDSEPDLDELAADIEDRADKLEWSFVAKPDKLVGEGAGGSVLWSSDRQSGVMTLHGLAANDPTTEQYQLWIVDREREGPPVDGGVFNVTAGAEQLRIAVDAKLLIGDPAAFVITVERPGGVVVSVQDRVVMVAAPP